ncbi:hypothetical protein CTN03_00445 [Photobacterium angustum]|nr:hypothetical protein UB39_14970 [Photobacterium angustum]PSW82946.1 hypothetical protein CTN03_00445 [Photobacterium angustum]
MVEFKSYVEEMAGIIQLLLNNALLLLFFIQRNTTSHYKQQIATEYGVKLENCGLNKKAITRLDDFKR